MNKNEHSLLEDTLSFQKAQIDQLIQSFSLNSSSCCESSDTASSITASELPPSFYSTKSKCFDSKKLNVAAYIRISTSFHNQKDSFESQKQYFCKRIQTNPSWNYAGIYFDYAVSGINQESRVGFQRLLRHCREGKIDRILCKSISRFHRNTKDFLEVIHLLQTKRISVFFEEENLDTTKPSDEFILTVLAAIAQEESRSISENVKQTIQMRFSKGDVFFRQIYGYRIVKAVLSSGHSEKRIVINQTEANVVRFIYRRALEGEKLSVIARELNQMLIPFPLLREVQRGRKGPFSSPDRGWTGARVRQILTNERYTGDALCQKTFKKDFLSVYAEKNTGQVPQYLVKNHHPAIVSREDFLAVQKLLSRTRAPSQRHQYPLSGRVVCGQCGRVYHLLPGSSDFQRWSCPQSADHKNSLPVCCEPWLYDIQIYRAVKKGVADRFSFCSFSKEQNMADPETSALFFSSLLSVLLDSSPDTVAEDERFSLRQKVQAAKQTVSRQKQRLDHLGTLLAEKKHSSSFVHHSSKEGRSFFMPEDTPSSLDRLEQLYQTYQKVYENSLETLFRAEAMLETMENYWKEFEKDDPCRKAAIVWISSLPHNLLGLQTFFQGLETIHLRAWIMKITVILPDTFELFWCDRVTTTVRLSNCLETEDDVRNFLSQKWLW